MGIVTHPMWLHCFHLSAKKKKKKKENLIQLLFTSELKYAVLLFWDNLVWSGLSIHQPHFMLLIYPPSSLSPCLRFTRLCFRALLTDSVLLFVV